MSVVYPESQIRHFSEELAKLLDREDDLTIAFLTREFRKAETSEFVRHGLVRRLFTLKHAIQRTFQILPHSHGRHAHGRDEPFADLRD